MSSLHKRSVALTLLASLSVLIGAALLFLGSWAVFSGLFTYLTAALVCGGVSFFVLGFIVEQGAYNLKIRAERMH